MESKMTWKVPPVCRDAVRAFLRYASNQLKVETAAIRPISFHTLGNVANYIPFDNANIDPFLGRTIKVRYTLTIRERQDGKAWDRWYGNKR